MMMNNVKPVFEWVDSYYGSARNIALAKECGPLKADRFTGVTEVLYTDLIPYTIVKTFPINLKTGYTKLIIQSDKVVMKSGVATMVRDTKGVSLTIERHSDGTWRAEGCGPIGQLFYVGRRHYFLDPDWNKPYTK
jgi:hypothetical protein